MARLYEYQGKQLLKKMKVPVPQGEVAATPQEARKIAERVGKPVAIKSQVWAGGRGKAGGIKFAQTPDEAEKAAKEILGMEIKKLVVEKVLVEEMLAVDKELRMQIGNGARLAAADYSIENTTRQVLAIYSDVLDDWKRDTPK